MIYMGFVFPGSSRIMVWGGQLKRIYYFDRMLYASRFRDWYNARESMK